MSTNLAEKAWHVQSPPGMRLILRLHSFLGFSNNMTTWPSKICMQSQIGHQFSPTTTLLRMERLTYKRRTLMSEKSIFPFEICWLFRWEAISKKRGFVIFQSPTRNSFSEKLLAAFELCSVINLNERNWDACIIFLIIKWLIPTSCLTHVCTWQMRNNWLGDTLHKLKITYSHPQDALVYKYK